MLASWGAAELAVVLRYSDGERKSYDYALGLSWTGLQLRRRSPVVPVSLLWAVRGDPVRRRDVRLSALSAAGA